MLADDFVESVEYFLNALEINSMHHLLDQYIMLIREPYCFSIIHHVKAEMNWMGLLNVKSG